MFKIPWDDINKTVEDATARTFDSIFNSLDGLEAEVQGMMDKDLEVYRDKIADQIIEDACKKTAIIGGGAALPDLLPVAGWSTFVAAVGADFALTLREDLSMLLKLAFLFGQDVSREDRKKQAVGLLAAVGAGEGGQANPAREVSKLVGMIGTKHISRRVLVSIGKRLGERFFKRKLVKLIPGVGILLSGGVNYYSTRQLGEYGRSYFIERADSGGTAEGIAGEMMHFQSIYITVLSNVAKKDGAVSPEEEDFLKDSMLMFGYTKEQQDRCMAELEKSEEFVDFAPDELAKLSADDKTFIVKQALAMAYADEKGCTTEQRDYCRELFEMFSLSSSSFDDLEAEVRKDTGL